MAKIFNWKGLVSFIPCISILLSVCACSSDSQNIGLLDPTSKAEVSG